MHLVCVTAEPKKLTHRPGKISLRKHVNYKKDQKSKVVFVFTYKSFIHAIVLRFHFHFPQNPGCCRIPRPWATFKSFSTFGWLIAVNSNTWYCSSPGCPQM